ncbi:zinc-dependent alcohol dehydrogenase [Harryflintia acetispora]|uniref:zinc-dependent alcohol dehydrogenase n=1 Tax=Harryflintia acetispora TaxID=1849041 RepID=UPI0018987A32|nr:alcohol dehydrogenase catalytic domain-containing protein [Harryflintia acetispora]
MKAVVLQKPKTIAVENLPHPQSDNDYLVVQVKACGICGSDVRYYQGENPWALHTLGVSLSNPPNIVLGHEFAGVVEQVKNPAYQHLLGKRVGVLAFDTCRVCDCCRIGQYNLCHDTKHLGHGAGWGEMDYYPGGMADYCRVWNTHVVELPDEVSYVEATLLDPISVAIHAVTLSGMRPGDEVLVMGSGPVGLSIAQAVKGFGAARVCCTDLSHHSIELARELGVDSPILVDRQREQESVCQGVGGIVDVVFDTVGTAVSQQTGLSLLKKSGTMVNLVANNTEASYRLSDLWGEKRILSSANNRLEDYLLGLDFIRRGVIDAKGMISKIIPLEQIQSGFDELLDREASGAMKIVIEP